MSAGAYIGLRGLRANFAQSELLLLPLAGRGHGGVDGALNCLIDGQFSSIPVQCLDCRAYGRVDSPNDLLIRDLRDLSGCRGRRYGDVRS